MVTRTSQYRTGAATAVSWSMAVFLLLLLRDRPADAYIDPGTGGAMFSSFAPILAMIGMLAVAALGFARRYVMWALRSLWRRRWVALAVMIAVALAAVYFIVVFPQYTLRSRDQTFTVNSKGGSKRQPPQPKKLRSDQHQDMELVRRTRPVPSELTTPPPQAVKGQTNSRLFGADEFSDIPRQKFSLNGAVRSCLVLQDGQVLEKEVELSGSERLVFSVAPKFPGRPEHDDSVHFALCAVRESGTEEILFETEWDATSPSAWQWQTVSKKLSNYGSGLLRLRFRIETHTNLLLGAQRPHLLLSEPYLLPGGGSDRPNFLLISIETLRRDHLDLYGYQRETMPFLKDLAREMIVFEEAYSQSSWTKCSVASLLSGLYPSQHGAVLATDPLAEDVRTVAEILTDQGYITGGFCTNGVIADQKFNYHQGFDLFRDERNYLLEEVQQDVLHWLETEKPSPFFCYIHTFDPHGPYTAPGELTDLYDEKYQGWLKEMAFFHPERFREVSGFSPRDLDYIRARYDAELAYTDIVLRRLVQTLKHMHLWDNTLVIITSDHGEEFQEHGGWGHGRLYPEVIRVPLLVKCPGGKGAGRRIAGVASAIDVVPTALSALGVPAPPELPGVDLMRKLESGRTPRDYHVAEYWHGKGPRTRLPHYASLTSQRYHYIIHRPPDGQPTASLFDLQNDPKAQRDLARELPDVLATYANLLREHAGYPGFTIAVNGGGKALEVKLIVRAQSPIVNFESYQTEQDDSATLSTGRDELRLGLSVKDDDDIVCFQTERADAAVTVEVNSGGHTLSKGLIFLGPHKAHPEHVPIHLSGPSSPADIGSGRTVAYDVGEAEGVFIWRQSGVLPASEAPRTDEETLQRLKDLGYL